MADFFYCFPRVGDYRPPTGCFLNLDLVQWAVVDVPEEGVKRILLGYQTEANPTDPVNETVWVVQQMKEVEALEELLWKRDVGPKSNRGKGS